MKNELQKVDWTMVKAGDILVQRGSEHMLWIVMHNPAGRYDQCLMAAGGTRQFGNGGLHALPALEDSSVLYRCHNMIDLSLFIAKTSQKYIPK